MIEINGTKGPKDEISLPAEVLQSVLLELGKEALLVDRPVVGRLEARIRSAQVAHHQLEQLDVVGRLGCHSHAWTKRRSMLSPTRPLFSGWNCVPTMLSLATAAVIGWPP